MRCGAGAFVEPSFENLHGIDRLHLVEISADPVSRSPRLAVRQQLLELPDLFFGQIVLAAGIALDDANIPAVHGAYQYAAPVFFAALQSHRWVESGNFSERVEKRLSRWLDLLLRE